MRQIRERYYDSTYGRMDWGAQFERHRAGLLGTESDEHFYRGLNAMFFELGVSHIGVIPIEHTTGDDYRQKLSWSGTHGLRLR